jgi:hypothetical protein
MAKTTQDVAAIRRALQPWATIKRTNSSHEIWEFHPAVVRDPTKRLWTTASSKSSYRQSRNIKTQLSRILLDVEGILLGTFKLPSKQPIFTAPVPLPEKKVKALSAPTVILLPEPEPEKENPVNVTTFPVVEQQTVPTPVLQPTPTVDPKDLETRMIVPLTAPEPVKEFVFSIPDPLSGPALDRKRSHALSTIESINEKQLLVERILEEIQKDKAQLNKAVGWLQHSAYTDLMWEDVSGFGPKPVEVEKPRPVAPTLISQAPPPPRPVTFTPKPERSLSTARVMIEEHLKAHPGKIFTLLQLVTALRIGGMATVDSRFVSNCIMYANKTNVHTCILRVGRGEYTYKS